MAKQLKLRRGTTAQHSTFTGASGEITVDTDKKTVVVHDGTTVGGIPLLPKTMTDGTANGVAYLNGSKVLTTGSALTFDGTNLATTGTVTVTKDGVGFRAASAVTNFSHVTLGNDIGGGVTYIESGKGGTGSYVPLAFFTNGSEQMRLTSTGLGIGTSSPSQKLDVAGIVRSTGSGANFLIMENSSNTGVYARWKRPNREYYLALDINNNGGTEFSLYDATAGATRWTVDSSGNFGIGTSSPAYKLDVVNSGDASARVRTTQAAVGASSQLLLETSNTFNSLSQAFVKAVSTNNGNAEIALTFGTSQGTSAATERARIDSSGNLLVGTTSNQPAGAAYPAREVIYSTGGTAQAGITVFTTSAAASNMMQFCYSGFGQAGAIVTNVNTTAYVSSSDYRLKENIQPMTGALAKVAQLKPVTYTWKVDGSAGEGFIAHELAEVCPQAVTGEKDAVDAEGNPQYQGIDVSFLVGTLTAAIQELKAEVDSLKAQLVSK